MAKKKASSSPSASSSPDQKGVLQFLRRVNRPYSATDMCTHLQGKYTKTTMAKALEKLIDQDLIVSKSFGKTVIYTVKQDECTNDDDQQLNRELEEYTQKADQLKSENRRRQQKLTQLKSTPRTEDAKTQLQTTLNTNAAMERELEVLKKQGNIQLSPDDQQRINQAFIINRKLWIQRRKLFKEILGVIMENVPINKAELLDAIDFQDDPIPYESDPLAV